MDLCFGGGMTPIGPRAGIFSRFWRRCRGRGVARVGVREVKVRVPSGFVGGGGATPWRAGNIRPGENLAGANIRSGENLAGANIRPGENLAGANIRSGEKFGWSKYSLRRKFGWSKHSRFSRRLRAEKLPVLVREVEVGVPSGFVGGGGTNRSSRAQETFTFFFRGGLSGQRNCESLG